MLNFLIFLRAFLLYLHLLLLFFINFIISLASISSEFEFINFPLVLFSIISSLLPTLLAIIGIPEAKASINDIDKPSHLEVITYKSFFFNNAGISFLIPRK